MKLNFKPAPRPDFISLDHWQDWTWQLRHSLKTKQDFESYFVLTESESRVFDHNRSAGRDQNQDRPQLFNIRTTPYYASLASKVEALDPIRRILVPHEKELTPLLQARQMQHDPLGELKKSNNPTARIVHRYSDRVLFLVTDICSVYCRYCTRKHFTGADQAFIKTSEYQQALQYIRSKTGLREVILSGGDPLTLADTHIERVLHDLRRIEHIEVIRIGTRMPVVAPMRVTLDLVKIIQKAKPVFLMTHFNHPRELTAEASQAIELFVDHGIPVMNQMVLLNGVNNHPAIVQALSRRLLYLRAKPYYMFQCDPSVGTDHLRTSIEDSLAIQRELWGHLSGLAMPTLSLDIPDGGGKTYYAPSFEVEVSKQGRTYKGWDGVQSTYINPEESDLLRPPDVENYLPEWRELQSTKAKNN